MSAARRLAVEEPLRLFQPQRDRAAGLTCGRRFSCSGDALDTLTSEHSVSTRRLSEKRCYVNFS